VVQCADVYVGLQRQHTRYSLRDVCQWFLWQRITRDAGQLLSMSVSSEYPV